MNVEISEHITLLLYSLVVGASLGVLYDAVRLLRTFLGLGIDYAESPLLSDVTPPIIGRRKRREQKKAGSFVTSAAVFVFDLLYMIAATLVSVIFIYHAYSGTPRGFALLGEAIGFYVYMKTAGRITAAVASYIFFAVDTVVRYAVYFTVTPIRFISRIIERFAVKVYRATVRRAAHASAVRRSQARESRYMKQELQKILSEMAEAVLRDDTEQKDV